MADADLQAELQRTARTALFVQRTALPVPLDHPARSYFGGLPKLPAHLDWPQMDIEPLDIEIEVGAECAEELAKLQEAKRSLHFAAQIDLSELPAIPDNPLPRHGTLYFFFDANRDYMDGHETRVLYYESSAHELPAREPPADLERFGDGSEPWPWLRDNELGGRIGFKHPLRFIPITSYCDHLDSDSSELAWQLQCRERDAKLPLLESAAPNSSAAPPWPFAWLVIEHVARAIRHEIDSKYAYDRHVPAALDSKLQEIAARADEWLALARQQPPLTVCDAATEDWFKGQWKSLGTAIGAVNQQQRSYLSLGSAVDAATNLACFAYAAQSSEAVALIPTAHLQTYEAAVRWQPRVQASWCHPMHQMLGYGTSVQSAPADHADDVLLLQIAGEPGLAWSYALGCVLQFWISSEALAACEFDAAAITLDCD